MSRIVSLVGETISGDLVPVALGSGETINKVLETREAIRIADGIWKKGLKELQFKHLNTLASQTSGGELKGRLTFPAIR